MKNKKLYLVSLGPGNYNELTIRTVKAIMESDTLFLPIRNGKSRAYNIIKDLKSNLDLFNFEGKEFPEEKFIESPMRRNYNDWETEVEQIMKEFETKDIITYGTLGDVGIYSRSYYLLEIIEKKHKELYNNTIAMPGISSFSYASAMAKKPLCTKDVNLSVVSYDSSKATTVYMKPKVSLRDDYPTDKGLIYFESVGTAEEKMREYKGEDIKEYMSLLIDFE